MKSLICTALFLSALSLHAATPSVNEIIQRARATVGSEKTLKSLITLEITGTIQPTNPKVPEASIIIIARKPSSQRLEVRMDNLVESTILDGNEGCIVRSNLDQDATQMRPLSESELQRVQFNTRQFFSFYQPDYKRGEQVEYAGIEQRRGIRCHKLIYKHPEGMELTRYFAVNDDSLISTVTDMGVESVEIDSQIIDGIKFPRKVEYYDKNEKIHTIEIAAIKVNKPLEPGIFLIPKAKSE